MDLIINTYGSYLRKNQDCFLIRDEETGKSTEISCKKISTILITTSAFISTDAIQMAMDNNIDIIFLDSFGDPYGRVWHSKLGSTVLIRRRQLEISTNQEGIEFAKEFTVTKLNNQIEFLEKLKMNRQEKVEILNNYIEDLQSYLAKINSINSETIDEIRNTLMGLEGTAGRIYFDALSFIMPDKYKFEGRSRNPAKDEFNTLLNYAYGVLYSLVEKACIIAGLDPYVGIIHTDNYNKKSMVFDLIEMFRIFADTTVVYLFSQRKVNDNLFDKIKGGLTLNKEGKAVLLEELNKTFDTTIRYRNRNIKKRDTIQFECHRIANKLIKKEN